MFSFPVLATSCRPTTHSLVAGTVRARCPSSSDLLAGPVHVRSPLPLFLHLSSPLLLSPFDTVHRPSPLNKVGAIAEDALTLQILCLWNSTTEIGLYLFLHCPFPKTVREQILVWEQVTLPYHLQPQNLYSSSLLIGGKPLRLHNQRKQDIHLVV